MRGKLFECVALYHPKPVKGPDGKESEPKSELIEDVPQRILATSEQQAGMMVARALSEKYVDNLDDVEVLIRPF